MTAIGPGDSPPTSSCLRGKGVGRGEPAQVLARCECASGPSTVRSCRKALPLTMSARARQAAATTRSVVAMAPGDFICAIDDGEDAYFASSSASILGCAGSSSSTGCKRRPPPREVPALRRGFVRRSHHRPARRPLRGPTLPAGTTPRSWPVYECVVARMRTSCPLARSTGYGIRTPGRIVLGTRGDARSLG